MDKITCKNAAAKVYYIPLARKMLQTEQSATKLCHKKLDLTTTKMCKAVNENHTLGTKISLRKNQQVL